MTPRSEGKARRFFEQKVPRGKLRGVFDFSGPHSTTLERNGARSEGIGGNTFRRLNGLSTKREKTGKEEMENQTAEIIIERGE